MSEEATPPVGWKLPKLRVNREGEWFDDDVQVTHPGIVSNLQSNLQRDADGYFIQTRVRIPVTVDDVPWVITRLERRGDTLHAWLNDGSEEQMDPATLRVSADNVPYFAVKDGRFEARCSRAAAFQLLAMAEIDAGSDVLRLGGRAYPLRRTA